MTAPNRVHLDATMSDSAWRSALCGWTQVDTSTDVTQVTCQSCLAKVRGNANGRTRGVAQGEVESTLASAFAETLEPCAGPPPVLDPASWAASCRGGEHRRCGACSLCEWEREAERWAAVAPWTVKLRPRRPEGGPAWSGLDDALRALAEWEAHDRFSPSAFGPMLDRVRRGDIGGGPKDQKGDDPILRRAGDIVRVRVALEQAYPEGAHATLTQAQRMRVLMSRTPGVLMARPTYETLTAELGVPAGELRALVRSGRRSVTVDLASRGMIPQPRPSTGLAEAVEAMRERMARHV